MAKTINPVTDLMSVHRLTGGRCVVVGEDTRQRAQEIGDAGLVAASERLIADSERYEDIRIRRRVQRIAKGDGQATEIDRVLDNCVRMMSNHLEGLKTAFAGQALHAHVIEIHARCFPEGLGAVITVPYEDELLQVRRVLGVLTEQPDAIIEGLGIRWHLDEIRRLLPAYAEALAARRLVTSGDLSHAREAMHASLCVVVAWIIAHYSAADQHATRDRLLAPVVEQHARLSALMRARRQGRASATPAEEADSIDEIVEGDEALDEAAALDDAASATDAGAAEVSAEGAAEVSAAE